MWRFGPKVRPGAVKVVTGKGDPIHWHAISIARSEAAKLAVQGLTRQGSRASSTRFIQALSGASELVFPKNSCVIAVFAEPGEQLEPGKVGTTDSVTPPLLCKRVRITDGDK